MARRAGFTLLELLVVIAITGVLVAAAWPSLAGFKKSADGKDAIDLITSVLRQEQAQAIGGQGNASHTVHYLSANSFSTRLGASTTDIATSTLPGSVQFSANFGDVTFARLTGTLAASKTITLNTGKTITITSAGTITSN